LNSRVGRLTKRDSESLTIYNLWTGKAVNEL
jgi:hypothetical protein